MFLFVVLQVTSVQLRDDLLSMLVAGHETTGSVLTWTLYLLSKVYWNFFSCFFVILLSNEAKKLHAAEWNYVTEVAITFSLFPIYVDCFKETTFYINWIKRYSSSTPNRLIHPLFLYDDAGIFLCLLFRFPTTLSIDTWQKQSHYIILISSCSCFMNINF